MSFRQMRPAAAWFASSASRTAKNAEVSTNTGTASGVGQIPIVVGRDISMSRVEPTDDGCRAARALVIFRQSATKKGNQAAADELGDGESGSGGQVLQGPGLIVS